MRTTIVMCILWILGCTDSQPVTSDPHRQRLVASVETRLADQAVADELARQAKAREVASTDHLLAEADRVLRRINPAGWIADKLNRAGNRDSHWFRGEGKTLTLDSADCKIARSKAIGTEQMAIFAKVGIESLTCHQLPRRSKSWTVRVKH